MAWLAPSFSIIDIRIGTPYLWPNQCSSGSSISLFIRTAIKSRKKNASGDLYRNSICSSPFKKSLVEPKRDGLVTHPLFRLGRPSLIHWAIQAYWKGGFVRAGRRKRLSRQGVLFLWWHPTRIYTSKKETPNCQLITLSNHSTSHTTATKTFSGLKRTLFLSAITIIGERKAWAFEVIFPKASQSHHAAARSSEPAAWKPDRAFSFRFDWF